jgi:hypothetical protein
MPHLFKQICEGFFAIRSKRPICLALTGPDQYSLVCLRKAKLRVPWPAMRLGADIEILSQEAESGWR